MMRSLVCTTFVALVISLGGCAEADRTLGTLVQDIEGVTPPAQALHERTYFAATDAIPIHAQPSSTSLIVGRLGLHERVTRTGIEEGFAYITSVNDLHGWVDAQQLATSLPKTAAHATHAPAAHISAPPTDVADTPAAPEADATNAKVASEAVAPSEPEVERSAEHAADVVPVADVEPAAVPARAEPEAEMLNPF